MTGEHFLTASDKIANVDGFAGLPAEANLLAAQAVSAGVPASCIIIEDKAQNSIENALNCLPILQSKRVTHCVLATSDYHIPRCRLLFELVLQGTGINLSWAEVIAAKIYAHVLHMAHQDMPQTMHQVMLILHCAVQLFSVIVLLCSPLLSVICGSDRLAHWMPPYLLRLCVCHCQSAALLGDNNTDHLHCNWQCCRCCVCRHTLR